MKNDIKDLQDIKALVDTFYGKVQKDPLIGPVFESRLQGHWPEHLQKMYSFWQTVLLEDYTYSGRPFPPHASLDVDQSHFDQWLFLFRQTLDELFQGEIAQEAKWRSEQMAKMFVSKINYFKEANQKPKQ
ncbi:group III truncated hemoglobin [Myroides sp. LJL115]